MDPLGPQELPEKITYRVEMTDLSQLRPKLAAQPGLRLERAEIPCAELNRFLHGAVGRRWRWGGRSDWDEERWRSHVSRQNLETWVLYVRGTPAGYFELERYPDGEAQILLLGLLPQFIGQGLGGHLVTEAVRRAFAGGATRVWLTTCSHDHPHALKNYQARGFRIVDRRRERANSPYSSRWEL
ncbi:MAG TPA: GNAT family N-acetyltransferase [Planctomycetes bacterium]|nr:GNAT family N-acetyltransferase [Planctomycetota bacterium]